MSSTRHSRHKRPATRLVWSPATYRWLAGALVLAALLLVTLTPHDQRRLRMPDPWAYEIATQQFAQGQWILNDDQAAQVRTDVRLRGGSLDQYVPIGDNQWAFRQSPGYPLLLVPFFKLGIPRAANLLLAIAAAIILYRLLTRRYDEPTAVIGVVLLAWSPISLLALHYLYMDTYASGILLVISGSILLWVGGWEKPQKTSVKKRQKRQNPVPAEPEKSPVPDELNQRLPKKQHVTWFLLFIAGLTAGWAVVVRNVNVLPVVVLGGYFLYTWWQQRQQTKQWAWSCLLAFVLGGLVAVTGLFAYNIVTFGGPIGSGYNYPSPDDSHYLWKGDPMKYTTMGTPTWVAEGSFNALVRTILDHLMLWVRPAVLGWPFLLLMLLAILWLRWRNQFNHIMKFLLLWILAVYAFYAGIVFFGVTRALSVPFNQTWGFFTPARYLFPATLPFILLTVDWLACWPRRWAFGFAFAYIALGGWIFWQVLKWT